MSGGRVTGFIGADGNRLVADAFGAGNRPVLLLHGGGQTRHAWDATGHRLSERGLRAWSVDLRGHGDSDWIDDGAYEFSDFARDVVALSDSVAEETGERPVAIGASLGGIASMLAEGRMRHGALSALVLVDITPRMDPAGVNKILSFMAERVHEGFASVDEAADAIARYLPHRRRPQSLDGLAKNLRRHDDGRYRWHWDPRFIDSKGADDAHATRIEADLIDAAKALRLPVLLVRGGRSELVSEEQVAEFRALVPHARFADVKDAGHMVAGDRNDVFADAVLSFLEELNPV